MASPGYEVGRPSPVATEAARMLERCVKESRAVDMESLCIIAGVKVRVEGLRTRMVGNCRSMIYMYLPEIPLVLKHKIRLFPAQRRWK